jgi:tetratricopeptide (TPR) repeat protein
LTETTEANPDWYTISAGNTKVEMRAERQNGVWVIMVPGGPYKHLLTIDRPWAAHHGQGPQRFAKMIIGNIRAALGAEDNEPARGPVKNELTAYRQRAYVARMLGDRLYGDNQPDFAIQKYEEAVLNAPDYVEAYEQLSVLYRKAGEKAKSEAIEKKLPDLKAAADWRAKGDEAYDEGNWDQAIQAYESAIKRVPTCLSFHLLLADACMEAGQKEKMINVLKNARRVLYPRGRSIGAPAWGATVIDLNLPPTSTRE